MADDSQFAVKVVTPERVLLDGTATEVILRTGDGDITFLAGHTPLVGTIEPGVIRVIGADGPEVRVASHGGFVQVERLVVLRARLVFIEAAEDDIARVAFRLRHREDGGERNAAEFPDHAPALDAIVTRDLR